jgi:glucose-6-phosphate dehydrogenase assembly protein OpcA
VTTPVGPGPNKRADPARRPSQVLARVDQELRALWAAAPSTSPSSLATPRTRACTMNLVVVVATPAQIDSWVAIVDEVLQSVPARALVVGLDPDGADDIDAVVSPVCTPGAGTFVCSERVTLRMSGVYCSRVASCVDALAAPDVPTTTVWLARVRQDDPAFVPLARWSQRVVLDAANGSLSSLVHVVQWARARPANERPGISELLWTRLAPWQELCARMFDDARLRVLAGRVGRVRLVQASPAGSALGAEAALMLGWLATRLGWKASSLAGKLRLLRADGAHIQVQLQAEPVPWAPRASLVAVELEAGDGATALRGEVVRTGAEQGVEGAGTWRLVVTVGGDTQRIEQRVRTFTDDPALLLERTLRRPAHDAALAESVAWADELGGDELVCA